MNLAQKWQALVRGESQGIGSSILRAGLSLLGIVYALLMRTRSQAYRVGILRSKNARVAIIAIGNLTLGGSAKTALAIESARYLESQGKRIGIILRGYKRQNKAGYLRVDLARKNPCALFGDEAVLIQRELPNTAVAVGANRREVVEQLLQETALDAIVLDDAFQHLAIKRDLNFLSLNENIYEAPYVFPRGILREPLSAIWRADAVLVQYRNSLKEWVRIWENRFGKFSDKKMARFVYVPTEIIVGKETRGLDFVAGKRAAVLSAIAVPENFARLIQLLGAKIEQKYFFTDHHFWASAELETISKDCANRGLTIFTTAKDAVKLPNDFPAHVLKVMPRFDEGRQVYEELLRNAL